MEQSGQQDSHLGVYKAVSQLRASQQWSGTALWSTHHVFAFLRHGQEADYVMVMNVLNMEVNITLETLLLEAGVSAQSGEVVIRSSGLGSQGNTVNSQVQLNDLTLVGYEALVIRIL